MESKLLRPLSQAVALALAAGGAHAASITVTDGGDAGTASTCTLRQAIQAANTDSAQGTCTAGSGADNISFASNLANSAITLTNGQLLVYSSVSISGSGQTISAATNSRVMGVYGYGNYGNTAPAVNLTDLTLSGGNSSQAGGGLAVTRNYAPLRPATRPHRHLKSRKAPAPQPTAPIVTLNQVTISNNHSNVTAGGLFVEAATVNINQSTISGNSLTPSSNGGAGGIFVTDNYSNGTYYGSVVTITDSTISGNRVSGTRNYEAGGIVAYYSQLKVTNSTITGNSVSGDQNLAGGMYIGKMSAAVYNSTITGNSATTIANAAAGGILVGANYTAVLTLSNSILAGNSGTHADMFVYGNAIAHSNLMGTALQTSYSGNGNSFNDAPGLGALANNGGPTLTMKPQVGSPALGAGNAALIPAGVTTDQRGVGYARVVNGALDLGSVEAAAGPVAVAATPAPMLSRWAMLALGGLLGLFGLRKRKRTG
jgi:CSLREA domain-containing protein/MYXO-CTERM domain-containing protein